MFHIFTDYILCKESAFICKKNVCWRMGRQPNWCASILNYWMPNCNKTLWKTIWTTALWYLKKFTLKLDGKKSDLSLDWILMIRITLLLLNFSSNEAMSFYSLNEATFCIFASAVFIGSSCNTSTRMMLIEIKWSGYDLTWECYSILVKLSALFLHRFATEKIITVYITNTLYVC